MTPTEKRKAIRELYPLWRKARTREGGCACVACWERLLECKFDYFDLNDTVDESETTKS